MSLAADEKACPDCAETIKAAALVCKHCGARFNGGDANNSAGDKASSLANDRTNPLLIFGGIGALILASCAALALTTNQLRPDPPDDHFDLQREARAYLTKDFLDPDSAPFKDVVATDSCVTGKVNGKNSFGAFTGYKSFYYNAKTQQGQIDPGLPQLVGGVLAGGKAAADAFTAYEDSEERCVNGGATNADRLGSAKQAS